MILLKNVFLNDKEQDILIQDNLICDISDNIIIPRNTNCQIMNCKGKAILPSFCNTHTHASMMFLRGIGEDKELQEWLTDDIWPREAKLTKEMIYHLSRFAILEMIKTGTSLFSDMYFYQNETIKAVEEMGIRGAISCLGMDFFNINKIIEQENEFEQFLSSTNHSDRIIKGLSCHSIYTTSEQLLKKAKELSTKYNTFLHIHLSETEKEVNDCISLYRMRPVELLDSWNILDNQTILAHCVHFNNDELDIISKSKARISHCPSSNLKLNSGIMPISKYLSYRINLTLGTDSVSSNNSLSMISEMKIASLISKKSSNNIQSVKVDDIYNMATLNGFNFFGINAGKIEKGKLADFILVDLNNVFLLPNINLKSNMIYSTDSSCITDLYCNGKPVMVNKHIKDESEIISEFKKICKILK